MKNNENVKNETPVGNTDSALRHVLIPENVMVDVMDYLKERPAKEVMGIINKIQTNSKVVKLEFDKPDTKKPDREIENETK